MKDRIPRQPGRVIMTDPATGESKRWILSMDDDPEEQGTPPTKVNLLTDFVASMFGLSDDPLTEDDRAIVSNAIMRAFMFAAGGGNQFTDLDDMQIICGSFTNGGSGWNSFTFPKRIGDNPYFDGIPSVIVQVSSATDARSVELTNITDKGFQYQVRPAVATAFVLQYIAIFDGGV